MRTSNLPSKINPFFTKVCSARFHAKHVSQRKHARQIQNIAKRWEFIIMLPNHYYYRVFWIICCYFPWRQETNIYCISHWCNRESQGAHSPDLIQNSCFPSLKKKKIIVWNILHWCPNVPKCIFVINMTYRYMHNVYGKRICMSFFKSLLS